MANHISRLYLCPDCDCVGSDAKQCPSCANRSGLLNLSSVLNRKPIRAEALSVLAMLYDVGKERLA